MPLIDLGLGFFATVRYLEHNCSLNVSFSSCGPGLLVFKETVQKNTTVLSDTICSSWAYSIFCSIRKPVFFQTTKETLNNFPALDYKRKPVTVKGSSSPKKILYIHKTSSYGGSSKESQNYRIRFPGLTTSNNHSVSNTNQKSYNSIQYSLPHLKSWNDNNQIF